MKEVWKPIEGYEDYYEVSNTGRVRGKTRTVNYIDGRVKVFETKEITPTPNTDGYMSLKLCRGNTYKTVRVHRLVAQAFIPNPKPKPYRHPVTGEMCVPEPSDVIKFVPGIAFFPSTEPDYADL